MTDVQQSSEHLEENIRSTRQNIDDKLGRLQSRLSPGDLVDSIVEFSRENGGAIARGVGRAVRDNPLPVAMIGAGVVWLALSNRDEGDDYESTGGSGGRFRNRAAEMTEGVRERTERLREDARHRASEMRQRAGEAGHRAREQALRATDTSTRFAKEHPLVLGAAGLLLGAALAAALPRTRREDETLGESSDRMKRAAKETAADQGKKAQTAARSAIKKAKEEAERQGLTPHDVKREAETKAKSGGGTGGPTSSSGASS